jgi:thioredoxin-like negative regulator of GroEL
MYKVDVDLVPDVAIACGVKAIPTYQIWKSGEKIDEMSGALPQRLVTMLKTHNVQEKSKFRYLRLAATVAAAVGGVFALLKYKAEVEAKEKGEREQLLVKRAEEQRKLKAQKERDRIKALDARGEKTVDMIGMDEDEDEWDDDDEEEEEEEEED